MLESDSVVSLHLFPRIHPHGVPTRGDGGMADERVVGRRVLIRNVLCGTVLNALDRADERNFRHRRNGGSSIAVRSHTDAAGADTRGGWHRGIARQLRVVLAVARLIKRKLAAA